MNAPDQNSSFVQNLARMAGDLTPAVDAGAMAGAAIRRERNRRVVLTVAGCLAVLVAVSGAIGAAGTVYADRQQPLPASTVTATTTPSSGAASASPSTGPSEDAEPAAADAPVRYLRTGDGELPVMSGVKHGVTEGGGAPYLFGGLWYEVPPGGWAAIGDVSAGGKIGWARPDSQLALRSETTELSIDDVVADLELRNVVDVSGWTVPDRDSGAMTLEIEGADLVVIEPYKVVDDGTGSKVRPVKTRIRSGAEGWVVETRFPADADGDKMLRDFLGNLWLKDSGEPEWYVPMFTYPELGQIEHAIPAGWTRAKTGGLSYAYPERWTAEPRDESTFGELVEFRSDEVIAVEPHFADPEVRWNGYVESGDPGANFWPGWFDPSLEGTDEIEVPGADYAMVRVTEGPSLAGDEDLRSLSVDVRLHEEGDGNHSKVTLNFPGGAEGVELVRQVLGTLSYER
ncbi:hypothetical protein [Myceligenerans xiligouense]|uniref:Uncharacterized protein n=1 Tax=Myceligenerans xiligouense TaxID=253184 RepID=A0A3N4YTG6_9MICO|nr:hypothetical protein [Myceligenerans xiligouense]RPF22756.1 hypothetical protein EDD34_3428 [Myceligenerans xiligouense]